MPWVVMFYAPGELLACLNIVLFVVVVFRFNWIVFTLRVASSRSLEMWPRHFCVGQQLFLLLPRLLG